MAQYTGREGGRKVPETALEKGSVFAATGDDVPWGGTCGRDGKQYGVA